MEIEELSAFQNFLLWTINIRPEMKCIGLIRDEANILAAYGLLRFAGNLQYEITQEGKELINYSK